MKQLKHVKPCSGSMQHYVHRTWRPISQARFIEGYIGSYSESYDENIS